MRVPCGPLCATALLLSWVSAAQGNISQAVSESASEVVHYCNQGHDGLTNPCGLGDHCCDFQCRYCGPADYCLKHSPGLAHSGACNPDYYGGLCLNYFQPCAGTRAPTSGPAANPATGRPTGFPSRWPGYGPGRWTNYPAQTDRPTEPPPPPGGEATAMVCYNVPVSAIANKYVPPGLRTGA
eukprot:TRINITY_DN13622_c0_g1_i1.p2 TRINITY_DN13622_c0_g1~~TRINITY_DN13622_c0_g1_i1.p2  ORF type:complete len:182 (+),score=0.05 TRINITY_DN13622_c0_g1_i1:84-629(+)